MMTIQPSPEPSRRPGLRPLRLVGLLVLLSACSADLESAGGNMPDDCATFGCGPGEVCTANGTCAPDASRPMTLALRIVPPEGDGVGLLEEHRLDIAIDGETRLSDIVMTPPTRVSGRAEFTNATGAPSPARLTFRRTDHIEGVTLRSEVQTDAEGAYTIDLVPGTYRVTVESLEEQLPPLRNDDLRVEGRTFSYNVSPPDRQSYLNVRGRLLRQSTDGEEIVPVGGARVQLLSAATGATVSTAAETSLPAGDGGGEFSVIALPSEELYVVRVSPTEQNPVVPSLTLGSLAIPEGGELGELLAGSWDREVSVTGSVFGQNGAPQPVVGASLFFEQNLELGTFTQLTRADAQGLFSVALIPGRYHITVVPPADANYGAESFDQDVDALREGEQIDRDLSHKPDISGLVSGPDGLPLSDVVVSATPIGFSVSSVALSPVSTVTDADGTYQLPVHAGDHRLTIEPPTGSGLAPRIGELQSVTNSTRRDIRLESATTVSGVVRSPDDFAFVVGARVEAFLIMDDEAMSFGQVETGEDGGFVINLPTEGL